MSKEDPLPHSVFRRGLLAGKGAIVSGGGTGIGFQIARELLSLGCNVLICSRSQEKLDAAVSSLQGLAGTVHARPCNIKEEESVESVVAEALTLLGRIDFLVNNAGGQFLSPAESISVRGFNAVVQTNLIGTFLMCREVYKAYMSEHGGSIVNITIIMQNGIPKMAHSAAARAGVTTLTRTLAGEWAPAGVRINCVAPGVIFTESGFKNYGAAGDAILEAVTPALPFKRLGTAEEVSAAVVFLLSPGAAYTSGATLLVDGGLSMVGYPPPLADTGGEHCDFPILGDPTTLPAAAKMPPSRL